MQEKLLMGGQLMDKAAKQEYELRQAHIELEERRRTEMELARELEQKEEEHIMVEEQFESMADALEDKRTKLNSIFVRFVLCVLCVLCVLLYAYTRSTLFSQVLW